ncbi:putative esterase [Alkalihalobacillus xiaoxiensis]|uniref:Esterase n=1 Tax=Shouchella xiaoxiensis TaxID=766895 RepID=A0ABS2SPV5_9BACI|nr:dienelactone hydrolase family protein [Shouchella xiaoxiensis]MBM7837196.1 putative esterase [Shouchella xiaoxiensis]
MQSFIHKSSNHQDVFIVLHGSGGRETDLLDVVGEVDPNLSVLGIRGQVAGKGFRYFNRPVHGQFDFAEIEKNTHKLASFIADEQTKHGLTKSCLHLVGYSNGANMATSLLYTYPAMFESAMLLHPSHLFKDTETRDLRSKPIFISSGARDTITLPGEAVALKEQLTEYGAEVTLKLTDHGHELTTQAIEAARNWWNK